MGKPVSYADADLAASLPGDFTSEHTDLGHVTLHHVSGGSGEPLFLLPGWPETWWSYRKVMPALAEHNRVIAVDIPGMGSSTPKKEGGYEKKAMAADILALARSLGYERINIAGHGIGAMVAFAFAANHPEATTRLAMLNSTHIDEHYYSFAIMPPPEEPPPHRWWLAFNLVPDFPVTLLEGRYRLMVDYMLGLSLMNPDAVSDFDREVYANAYSDAESIRACQAWFQSYQRDVADFGTYGTLEMPVLGLAYAGVFHDYMAKALPTQGSDVRVVEVHGSRNYLMEEQPETIARELSAFLKG